jgi:hypothetical protein
MTDLQTSETPATETETETPAVAAVEPPVSNSVPLFFCACLLVSSQKEEKKESRSKFTRRLSARVGELFKKSKSEVPTPAKVDEYPPVIDEPTPVAPLENPASGSSVPAETPAEPSEPQPVEPTITATPVVAAAA